MAKVIILSGAGISAESGISTFRDSGGLWENHRLEDVCTAGCLERNRKITVDFYDSRRVGLIACIIPVYVNAKSLFLSNHADNLALSKSYPDTYSA